MREHFSEFLKRLMPLAAVAIVLGPMHSSEASASEISGYWKTPPSLKGIVRIIEIKRCGLAYCLYLKGMGRPGKINTAVSGKIKSRFKRTNRAGVYEGHLVAADDGKKYSGTATVRNKNRLHIAGCTKPKTSCRKQTWFRIDWNVGS